MDQCWISIVYIIRSGQYAVYVTCNWDKVTICKVVFTETFMDVLIYKQNVL